jgi:hypothetical protein
MIPLVPADRLPYILPGIPRELGHDQLRVERWMYLPTDKTSMTSVRTQERVTHPVEKPKPKFLAPDHRAKMESSGSLPSWENVTPITRPTSMPHYSAHAPATKANGIPPEPEQRPKVSEHFLSRLLLNLGNSLSPTTSRRFTEQMPSVSGTRDRSCLHRASNQICPRRNTVPTGSAPGNVTT